MQDFFNKKEGLSKTIHEKYFSQNKRFLILEQAYNKWSEKEANPGVEAFFNHLEFLNLIGMSTNLGQPYGKISAARLHRYLVWYISAFIRNSIAYKRNPPKYYDKFAENIKENQKSTSIISFNYDQVLESKIADNGGRINYSIIEPPVWGSRFLNERGSQFLKLHGSLNWIWCPKCGKISITNYPVAQYYSRQRCSYKCNGMKEPLIVPPNLSKSLYLNPLGKIWSAAYRRLIGADKIIIIGYSLPEIDTAARALLTEGIRNAKRFEVILPDKKSLVSIEKRLGRSSDNQSPMDFRTYAQRFL